MHSPSNFVSALPVAKDVTGLVISVDFQREKLKALIMMPLCH